MNFRMDVRVERARSVRMERKEKRECPSEKTLKYKQYDDRRDM